MRDIETIDSELRLVGPCAVRLGSGAARCRRYTRRMRCWMNARARTALGNNPQREFSQFPTEYLMGATGAAWSVSSS